MTILYIPEEVENKSTLCRNRTSTRKPIPSSPDAAKGECAAAIHQTLRHRQRQTRRHGERGVRALANLARDRYWAGKTGWQPMPGAGGDSAAMEVAAGMDRAAAARRQAVRVRGLEGGMTIAPSLVATDFPLPSISDAI
jgi:hypothetical protein